MPHLFCFGLGYSASRLAALCRASGWRISGTSQTVAGRDRLLEQGIEAHLFDTDHPLTDADVLAGATHILTSVPADQAGDPVLAHHGRDLERLDGLAWFGYLSATSVYGDTGGDWVDETAPTAPTTERGRRRVAAEAAWAARQGASGLPVHIFRLAGIYGPGRSALDQLRSGLDRRIDKPGHVFSRIHVDDIVAVLWASMMRPNPGALYNVCDDEPAPSADVIAFACGLLGVDPPPLIPVDDASLSPMARSFYADNRRVRNDRIKEELGIDLLYPDYRAGLRAILAEDISG